MLTIIGLGLGGPNSITMDGVIALSLSDTFAKEADRTVSGFQRIALAPNERASEILLSNDAEAVK